MSTNIVQKGGEPCPRCGKEVARVIGPAEETKLGRQHHYVLEVLRCNNCNHSEVLSKLDITEELDKLLGRNARAQAHRPSDPSRRSGISGLRYGSPSPGDFEDFGGGDDFWKGR